MRPSYESSETPRSNNLSTADLLGGSRAAPLLLTGPDRRDELVIDQELLHGNAILLARQELRQYVKEPIVNYVASSILSRMAEQEGSNSSAFTYRRNRQPNLNISTVYPPEYVEAAIERAFVGQSNEIDNELTRLAFNMLSIEYGNITIVGQARKELEAPMWDGITNLTGTDATPQGKDIYRLKFLGTDRNVLQNQHIGAVRLGMKRRIGTLKDGTEVKSRTTAIVNFRPSTGIDQSIAEEIISLAQDNYRRSKIENFDYETRTMEDVAATQGFQSMVRHLIDNELEPGVVLARNETVYGVSPNN